MNKTELIAAVAEKAEFSKKDAEKAVKAFTDVIADDEAVITENSSIMDDLDMDSIEMQEALSDLEEEFDIEILDSMLKRMITIGDIIDVIAELQEKAN